MKFEQGNICMDQDEVLFMVAHDEPQTIHWNGQAGCTVIVGARLDNGAPILATHAKLVAKNFHEYVASVVSNNVPAKSEKTYIGALIDGEG